MTHLPQMLRRLPYLFYALAVLFFAWQLANQWATLSLTYQYGDDGGMHALGKSMALYAASTEAAYMFANGALVHVLIAIYDKVKGA